MATSKEIKLPKYLKLAKGTMWLDIEGEDSSGIRLFNVEDQFVGRGYITNEEHAAYAKSGVPTDKPVPEDIHKNAVSTQNEYGYIKMKKDNSYFCIDGVPKEKQAHILTAYNNKILVAYNPKSKKNKELPKKEETHKNFAINKDGDIVFKGKNKEIYSRLQNLTFKDLKSFILGSGPKSRSNLMDMYDYEINGHNSIGRARHEVLELIRDRLNSFSPGISPIAVNDGVEDVKNS